MFLHKYKIESSNLNTHKYKLSIRLISINFVNLAEHCSIYFLHEWSFMEKLSKYFDIHFSSIVS